MRIRAFTLIELLIVVSLLATLGIGGTLWRQSARAEHRARAIDDLRHSATRLLTFLARDLRSADSYTTQPQKIVISLNRLSPAGELRLITVSYEDRARLWVRVAAGNDHTYFPVNSPTGTRLLVQIDSLGDHLVGCTVIARRPSGEEMFRMEQSVTLGDGAQGTKP